MELTRISRKIAHVAITAKLADGSATTVAGVDFALLPVQTRPTATTTWVAAAFSSNTATVLLAGPDASPTGAMVVPSAGADLWARITDNPEVDAARIDRIVIG